jgi:hypothetical protein
MDDALDLPDCPQCGGPPTLLGQLGSLLHLRCRNCGMTYAMTHEPEPKEDE